MKVWKSAEDLPRVLGEVCVILAHGEYGEDCVSSSLNTQPLQLDVQLSHQLELVYQLIVCTKPTGSISSTFHFLIYVLMDLSITVWRHWLKTFSISSIQFLQPHSLQPAYPVITLSVLYACFHFIMMTMLLLCYAYTWVLIPLLVCRCLEISSPRNSSVTNL